MSHVTFPHGSGGPSCNIHGLGPSTPGCWACGEIRKMQDSRGEPARGLPFKMGAKFHWCSVHGFDFTAGTRNCKGCRDAMDYNTAVRLQMTKRHGRHLYRCENHNCRRHGRTLWLTPGKPRECYQCYACHELLTEQRLGADGENPCGPHNLCVHHAALGQTTYMHTCREAKSLAMAKHYGASDWRAHMIAKTETARTFLDAETDRLSRPEGGRCHLHSLYSAGCGACAVERMCSEGARSIKTYVDFLARYMPEGFSAFGSYHPYDGSRRAYAVPQIRPDYRSIGGWTLFNEYQAQTRLNRDRCVPLFIPKILTDDLLTEAAKGMSARIAAALEGKLTFDGHLFRSVGHHAHHMKEKPVQSKGPIYYVRTAGHNGILGQKFEGKGAERAAIKFAQAQCNEVGTTMEIMKVVRRVRRKPNPIVVEKV